MEGYHYLLQSKRNSLRGAAEKLSNGLIKLDETRLKVEEMSVTLEETKKLVAKLQKECEEYLMVMVQRKQDANEKAKVVAAKSEKIAQEEAEIKEIASAAQIDLDKALPGTTFHGNFIEIFINFHSQLWKQRESHLQHLTRKILQK